MPVDFFNLLIVSMMCGWCPCLVPLEQESFRFLPADSGGCATGADAKDFFLQCKKSGNAIGERFFYVLYFVYYHRVTNYFFLVFPFFEMCENRPLRRKNKKSDFLVAGIQKSAMNRRSFFPYAKLNQKRISGSYQRRDRNNPERRF